MAAKLTINCNRKPHEDSKSTILKKAYDFIKQTKCFTVVSLSAHAELYLKTQRNVLAACSSSSKLSQLFFGQMLTSIFVGLFKLLQNMFTTKDNNDKVRELPKRKFETK